MEIIVGRDTEKSRLVLTADGKNAVYGQPGSVPQSVGSQHCLIVFSDKGIRLKNLDINNYTYVNGQSIESKSVTEADKIELGADRYVLSWEAVKTLAPADIRQLKTVWDEYENQNIGLQIKERKFNTLRSTTGLITMVAIALSIATGGRSFWYMALYGLAILVSLVFFIKAYRDSSAIPQKRQVLSRNFQHDYVCPHCGHFMGNQSYDIVAQNGYCPYCKTQFIH